MTYNVFFYRLRKKNGDEMAFRQKKKESEMRIKKMIKENGMKWVLILIRKVKEDEFQRRKEGRGKEKKRKERKDLKKCNLIN